MELHARAEAPKEACGLVAVHDNIATHYFPGENVAEHPEREFKLDLVSEEAQQLEEEGWEIGIFHSHPTREAMVSAEDWRGGWRGKPYFVFALKTGELFRARL